MMDIVKASTEHLDQLVPLFDSYRVFYGQASDHDSARAFLKARLSADESTIFLAFVGGEAIGFTQLFPSFSSVALRRILILNDLYVTPGSRGSGVGKALLEKAKSHCQALNYRGLALETARDNPAQYLYEKAGWEKDTQCFHYFWTAPE